MSDKLTEYGHDIQQKIQDLAYTMWEYAGRQQGLALEYWLAAEKEILATMQAAAGTMKPKAPKAAAKTAAKPAAKATAAKKPAARKPAAKKTT